MSDERAPRRRDLTRAERELAARRMKAWRTAFDEFPEMRVGSWSNPDAKTHPCPWLVWAILNVSAKGPVKRGAVLAERRRLMGRTEERSAAA